MNCPYCRASNIPDDHRCQRCGRRLDTTPQGAYARPSYGRAATAPALHYEAETEPGSSASSTAAPEQEGGKRKTPFQPSLFSSPVVSFESFAPEAVEPKQRGNSRTRTRPKKEIPGQESFSFETVITQPTPAKKASEPLIGCEARVAVPLHRLLAAAYDLSMVGISLALFLLVFQLASGQLLVSTQAIPMLVGIAVIFYVMYELLWCMADADTAGMRWAGLRLIDFDGNPPTREQRMVRVASGCLSLLAAGLGVLWAFVDEEALTWHDHISRCFPTRF